MIRSSYLKIVLAVQIIALVICTFPYPALVSSAQGTTVPSAPQSIGETFNPGDASYVQSLEDQRAQLQHQANELQQARQFYSDSLDGLIQQKDNIEKQITLKQQEIDINALILESLNAQIDITDEQLILAEQTMLLKRQTLLTRFEELRQKLRDLSKGGSMTPIQMLLNTDSFTSFLINMKMASRISQADQQAISALETELAEVQAQQEELSQQQTRLEEARRPHEAASVELEIAKTELLSLHAESIKIEDMLSENLTYYRTQYLELLNEQRKLHLQLTDILGKYDMSGVAAPTLMFWPTPECTIITSSYKARWGKWHYGLDIACYGDATGKSVLAAADGTVIFAGYDESGYGNYVIIDHGYDVFGRRVVTLYGHCHELLVKEGDIVLGGQTRIALVGDTGRSSGAHLHFEVRLDGSAVDPVGEGFVLTDNIAIVG